MKALKIYKTMPQWDAKTLPQGFRQQHNTREGTWAQLTVTAGSLRFTFLTEDGEIISSHIIDVDSGPQLIDPGVWHQVEPIDDALRCQLSFLCEPQRYLEKKYDLSAPHSEVRGLLSTLQAAPGRSVLDLGSGRGRNSFYLSEHGFNVTSVDRSESAIETLREIQKAEGFEISSSIYDINHASLAETLPGGVVDHIISTVVFQFLDPSRVRAVIEDMQQVTRAEGLHLIVAPLSSEAHPCPIELPFLFQKSELREYYRDWELVRYDESVGEFHRRDEHGERYRCEFATLVARKPKSLG